MDNEDNVDNEYYEVLPKKMKTEWSKSYSNKVMQMMKKMGYEKDKGLGKQSQGRLEPIVAFQQDGRRGLGLKDESALCSVDDWDPNSEEINIPEIVSWLRTTNNCVYTLEQLEYWLRVGERKETLDDETFFVDPDILRGILSAKTAFDQLNENELRRARSRSNPFETIRSSIFQNRAAVKLANIDSMLGFMITNPKDKMGSSLVGENNLLYFADICAGPGGFSEYIFYRKSWRAKGFGLTLRGANDFKLDKFFAGSPESFDPYYGVRGDGDIYAEENQDSFANYIFKHCDEGVHFVLADGGFSVEGQENIQEILSKRLYLCQCLTALKIIRCNGSFVCKLFDVFTPFSVGLIYVMYLCFEEIAIIKPNSSRPANSERYLICKWKKSDTDAICKYLNAINNNFNNHSDQDILQIVPMDVIMQNAEFFNYIKESNNLIGKNQIIGLKKITAFCSSTQLKETRQSEFRKKCLRLWVLPDKLRQAPENKSVEKFLEEFLSNWHDDRTFFNSTPIELVSSETLSKWIRSIHDWYFVPIGRGETSFNTCSFFICTARGKLLRYTDIKKWEPVEHMFEIPPKTLLYGEIVFEYNGEGRTQTRICCMHIIDAILLGGKDIRRLPLNERLSMCSMFAKSINKPYKEGSLLLRSKSLSKLKDIDNFFNVMHRYTLKDGSMRLGISLNNSDTKFFVPGGILLLCEISHNFYSIMSKSQNMLYYFDKTENSSYYKDNMPAHMQNTLYASFRNSFIRRLLWKWTNTYQVEKQSIKMEENVLYRDDFVKFALNKKNI